MLKKSSLFFSLGFIISSTAHAVVVTKSTNVDTARTSSIRTISADEISNVRATNFSELAVLVPNIERQYEFSAAALALQPNARNLNYVIYNNELPAQSPNWTEKEIRPNYDFGFALGARYFVADGKDINLTWTHLNSTTHDSVSAPNEDFFLGPDYEIGPDGTEIRDATGKANFSYNVINLDFGQYVQFGNRVLLRFFAGLSNGYLDETVTAVFTGNVPAPFSGPFSLKQKVTSDFSGLGPRFGIGGAFDVGNGFGVIGEAAASALIGNSHSKATFVTSSPILEALFDQETNYQFIKDERTVQVIPAFDAKLGLSYAHTVNRGMLLTLKAGYQAAVYINAINQYLPGSLVVPLEVGGIFVDTMSHTQSNYSVQGPFLEASLRM